jgi:hypothetical protein
MDEFNAQAKAGGWPARVDLQLHLEAPQLTSLLAIWRKQAGERAMPRRDELSARVLKDVLAHVTLFERIGTLPDRRYRLRLMGTAISRVMGEFQDKYIEEFVPEKLLPRWNAMLDLILGELRPVRFTSRVDFHELDFLSAELLAVPLADAGGVPTMVMAGIVFSRNREYETLQPGQ